MNINKLKEVLNDQEFVEKLFGLENVNDIQNTLSEKGIDLSIEEIEATKDMLIRYQNNELTEQEKKIIENAQTENDELNEDQLEAVTGGSFFIFMIVIAALSTTVLVGGMAAKTHVQTRGRW